MSEFIPLTKAGDRPNRAGRKRVSTAMRRLLDEGQRFTDPDAQLDPDELRSWTTRLSQLSADLADCVEAPMRNRILVVNTDADQVIVASAGPHRSGDLPEISYESGGLEDPEIRRQVCEILEGGQQAFTERARRLRVRLPR